MRGAAALIRLSTFEVETLQKRLADIADRRAAVGLMLDALEAEARVEGERARADAEAGFYLIGFREGLRIRCAKLEAQRATLDAETVGARDALTAAFESLKKVEHVADLARVALAREAAKREGAALDELALRRAVGR